MHKKKLSFYLESFFLYEVLILGLHSRLFVFIRINSCLKIQPHRKIPNRLTLEEGIHFPGSIES